MTKIGILICFWSTAGGSYSFLTWYHVFKNMYSFHIVCFKRFIGAVKWVLDHGTPDLWQMFYVYSFLWKTLSQSIHCSFACQCRKESIMCCGKSRMTRNMLIFAVISTFLVETDRKGCPYLYRQHSNWEDSVLVFIKKELKIFCVGKPKWTR